MYIGKTPQIGNYQVCDAISVVNGQAAYTMQVSSANVSPESVNHMIVSLNGIIQKPGSSFTISGSTITFASNLATGDVIDYIMLLGNVLDLGTPSDNTVTAAKIGANAVTGAKLNTDVISAQTALATAPADTDEFLVSDAGVLKRIDYSLIKGGGITMVDQWRLTTSFTGSVNPLASNWERNDTSPAVGYYGSQMSESSGIFTFPSTGIYHVFLHLGFSGGDNQYVGGEINVTTDNSTYETASVVYNFIKAHGSPTYSFITTNMVFDITDTTNQKVRFRVVAEDSGTTCIGSTETDSTFVRFIRLGDT